MHTETDAAATLVEPTETESHAAHDGHEEGCGCGHGTELEADETAAMQGFLSGLYASTLDREELAQYLENMTLETGSEFARPAEFLADALAAFEDDGTGRTLAAQFLDFVSGDEEE